MDRTDAEFVPDAVLAAHQFGVFLMRKFVSLSDCSGPGFLIKFERKSVGYIGLICDILLGNCFLSFFSDL